MQIYTRIKDLVKGRKNFAYFCRFDDSGTNGREFLFLSDKPGISIFDRNFNEIDPLLNSENQIPAIITYDFVDSIYPSIGIKRSVWPKVLSLNPEKTILGSIERRSSPQLRNPASAIDDTTLREDISKAVNLIRSGELLQVVFSKRIFIDPIDPFALLRKFTEQDSSLYTYLYSIDGFLAVGSSPEKVVTVIGDEIEINPIAGTRKRGKTVTDDLRLEGELRTDPKELNEHRMLVDLARNDLGKVSKPGSVRVTRSMDLRKYVSVQHLVSTVVGIKKSETSNLDILRAVFPAGTVSGAPKERAIEIINRFEKFPRGPYAGAIGVVSSNFMDLALSIRTVFGDAQGIYVQSGAGIVKDSIPEREEEEMREKLGSIVGGVTAESTGN